MLGGDEEHGSRDAVTLNMIGTRIHITNSLTRVLSLGTAELDASQSPTREGIGKELTELQDRLSPGYLGMGSAQA